MRRSRQLLALTASASMLVTMAASPALADNVHNEFVAGGTDTVAVGGSTTVSYRIAATNNDGQDRCNASDGSAAVLSLVVPAGVSVSSTATGWSSAAKSLTFSACGEDGAKSVAFSSATAGNYNISVTVADAGSTSTVGTYDTARADFTLHVTGSTAPADTVAPTVTITSKPTAASAVASPSFAFVATETSTFTCALDAGDYGTCTSPKSYTSLTDGSHTFSVKATDAASNTSAAESYTWLIDTMAPSASITSSPTALTSSPSASFALASSEAGSTFTCSLDGAAFGACTTPKAYSNLADGVHTFAVKATDAAGNTSPAPASYAWRVDGSAPNTTITDKPATLSNTTSASIAFTSTETPSTFTCALGTAMATACSSPVSLTNLEQGSNTFTVAAHDAAGNADATPASYTWTVDSLAPAVSAPDLTTGSDTGTSQEDNKTNASTPTLSGAAEAGSLVTLTRDGVVVGSTTASSTGTWSVTSGTLTSGSYVFAASATDAAGNSARSDDLTVLVDLSDPSITYDSRTPANGSGWNNGNVAVTWTCSDSSSGPVVLSVTTTVSTEGTDQPATGECADVAGNMARDTQTGINIDKTNPTITFANRTAANAAGWNNTNVTVSWTCTDGRSQPVASPVTTVLDTEGVNLSTTGTCTDLAGNTASDTQAGMQIDKTNPAISYTSRTAPNEHGWNNGNVALNWACSDSRSGPLSATVSRNVTAEGTNQSASGQCLDVAGNAASDTQDGVNIDTTAPTTTFVSRTEPNVAGWSRMDVVLNWGCMDDRSGPVSDAVTQTVTAEGDALSSTGTCTDKASNSTGNTQTGIKIDKTAPDVLPSDVTNTTWRGIALAQGFTSTDGLSGLLTPAADASFTLTASDESTRQADNALVPTSVSRTVTDIAGNSTTRSLSAQIDLSDPVISGSDVVDTVWRNSDRSADFTASDRLSGLAVSADSAFRLTATAESTKAADGTIVPTEVSHSVADLVGNTATRTLSARIDKTVPVISGTNVTNTTWRNTPLTENFTASDTLSGLSPVADASISVTASAQSASATQPTTGSRTVADAAGNVSAARTVSALIDLTAPVVTCAAPAPRYTLNAPDPSAVGATVSDALSGPVNANASAAPTVTSVGNKSVTLRGSDRAGNTASVTCVYSVVYNWTGFFQPIDNNPDQSGDVKYATVWNSAKAGSAIPVKFSLGGDQGMGVLASTPTMNKVTCPSSAASADSIEEYSGTTSGLKYDVASGQYNYTFKSSSTMGGGCYMLTVTLADQTNHYAFFKFVK